MNTFPLIFREIDRATFDRIASGEKSIETRAGSLEYLKISVGDILDISCGNNHIKKTVTETMHFKNVNELLETLSVEDILPEGTTTEQAIEKWNGFPGYPERIVKYGIIAWRLK